MRKLFVFSQNNLEKVWWVEKLVVPLHPKLFVFSQNNLEKVWWVEKLVVPLHPLSLKKLWRGTKREFFERLT